MLLKILPVREKSSRVRAGEELGKPRGIRGLDPSEEERDGVSLRSSSPVSQKSGWEVEQECQITPEPGLKATGTDVFLAS